MGFHGNKCVVMTWNKKESLHTCDETQRHNGEACQKEKKFRDNNKIPLKGTFVTVQKSFQA